MSFPKGIPYRTFEDLDPYAKMEVNTEIKSDLMVGNQNFNLIKIYSGIVAEEDFASESGKAIAQGYVEGILDAWFVFDPTIAKLTGNMRAQLRQQLYTTLQEGILSLDPILGDTVAVFNMIELILNTIPLVPYVAFHYIYGPTGQSSYRDPSTPGTKPIDDVEFLVFAVPAVVSRTLQALVGLGFEVT